MESPPPPPPPPPGEYDEPEPLALEYYADGAAPPLPPPEDGSEATDPANDAQETNADELGPLQPKTIKEMSLEVNQWTLASDSDLLLFLKNFSANLTNKTRTLEKSLDDLIAESGRANVRLKNSFNEFLLLSHTQFIENRVYDEDVGEEEIAGESDEATAQKTKEAPEGAAKSQSVIPKFKEALDSGLQAMKLFALVDYGLEGEEIQPEFEDALDIYNERPLPFVIGTREFLEDDTLGLGAPPERDSSSSSSDVSISGSESSEVSEDESESESEHESSSEYSSESASEASESSSEESDESDSEPGRKFAAQRSSSFASSIDGSEAGTAPKTVSGGGGLFGDSDSSSSDEDFIKAAARDQEVDIAQPAPAEETLQSQLAARLAQRQQQGGDQSAARSAQAAWDDDNDDDDDLFASPAQRKPRADSVESTFTDLFGGEEKAPGDVDSLSAPPPSQMRRRRSSGTIEGGLFADDGDSDAESTVSGLFGAATAAAAARAAGGLDKGDKEAAMPRETPDTDPGAAAARPPLPGTTMSRRLSSNMTLFGTSDSEGDDEDGGLFAGIGSKGDAGGSGASTATPPTMSAAAAAAAAGDGGAGSAAADRSGAAGGPSTGPSSPVSADKADPHIFDAESSTGPHSPHASSLAQPETAASLASGAAHVAGGKVELADDSDDDDDDDDLFGGGVGGSAASAASSFAPSEAARPVARPPSPSGSVMSTASGLFGPGGGDSDDDAQDSILFGAPSSASKAKAAGTTSTSVATAAAPASAPAPVSSASAAAPPPAAPLSQLSSRSSKLFGDSEGEDDDEDDLFGGELSATDYRSRRSSMDSTASGLFGAPVPSSLAAPPSTAAPKEPAATAPPASSSGTSKTADSGASVQASNKTVASSPAQLPPPSAARRVEDSDEDDSLGDSDDDDLFGADPGPSSTGAGAVGGLSHSLFEDSAAQSGTGAELLAENRGSSGTLSKDTSQSATTASGRKLPPGAVSVMPVSSAMQQHLASAGGAGKSDDDEDDEDDWKDAESDVGGGLFGSPTPAAGTSKPASTAATTASTAPKAPPSPSASSTYSPGLFGDDGGLFGPATVPSAQAQKPAAKTEEQSKDSQTRPREDSFLSDDGNLFG